MTDPAHTNGRHPPPPPQDATEASLFALLGDQMKSQEKALTSMGHDIKAGMEAMAKQMRDTFRMLVVVILMLAAGIIATQTGMASIKVPGIEVHAGPEAAAAAP